MPTTAEQLMSPADADIHVDHNLVEAEARFDKYGRDRLLVLDADEVVGALHRDDLPADRSEWKRLTVQEVMEAVALPTCSLDADVDAVRGMLREHPFVLVLDREREILGIIERESVSSAADPGATGREQHTDDPTGGRAPARREGKLHVYADKPRVRRLREPD